MRKNIFITLSLLLFSLQAGAVGKIQNENVKSQAEIKSANGTITGNLTNGSACIASPSSTTGLFVGLYAYDSTTSANIPSGATIAGLPGSCSAGQIQLSANAAGSGTGDTITFGGQLSQLINDTKIYATGSGVPLATAIANGLVGADPGTSAIASTVIDWSILKKTGGGYLKTLAANTTFTFTNLWAGQIINTRITNTASNYTVTWPTVKWINTVAPTQTIGAHTDICSFFYDGTDVYGNCLQNY
jgi:hypothetical protein